jgi:U6 snRNA-associated Sm-like protein LSm4
MMFFEMQLVELKNGETYNGHLVNCDTWMNIHLREVICTSKVGMLFMTIACERNLFIL